MQADLIDFLLWKDADSGGWTQNPAAVTHNQGYRLYVDPFLSFHSPGGFRHQLKTRYFRTYNNFPQDPEKDNEATQLFADYQLHKRLDPGVELTAGFAASTARSEASLFGDHRFRNLALFAQADKAFGLLTLSLGARWEYFRLDDVKESRPVVRAGVNYRAWDYTFLRASFGQGYRFPSIAEKFTTTSVGGVNVFPNPYLGSETGWSAEAGLRQGYHLGGLQGYLDVALFWTEYQEMMEFSFGFYDTITFLPTTEYLSLDNMGFQSQNIGRARIAGLETVITGQGRIGRFPLTFMLGYTYTDPVDENSDSAYRAGKSVEDDILKYRYRHSFQADVMMGYGRLSLGMGWVWHSYLECVDQIFVDPVLGQLILPGYREYRNLHDGEAYSQVDVRAGFQLSPSLNVAVMSRNLFNRENIGRPGDLRPPRSLLLTLRLRL